MRFLAAVIMVLVAEASLQLASFSTQPNTTTIYQLNASAIIGATANGNLQLYGERGRLLKEKSFHQSTVVFISSFMHNTSQFIISADKGGIIALWDAGIDQNVASNLSAAIISVSLAQQDEEKLLAVNKGNRICFYRLPLIQHVRSLNSLGVFRRMDAAGASNMFGLIEGEKGNSIVHYNYLSSELTQMLAVGSEVVDFAVCSSSQESLLYLLDGGHLEIYRLAGGSPMVKEAKQEENLAFPQDYSRIGCLRNSRDVPMLAAVKSQRQLHLFSSSRISAFMQFSSPLRLLLSSLSDSLLLLSSSDLLTKVGFTEERKGNSPWLLLLLLALLGAALYICCSDCSPQFVRKWREEREQRQIELVLFKKRTELDNF